MKASQPTMVPELKLVPQRPLNSLAQEKGPCLKPNSMELGNVWEKENTSVTLPLPFFLLIYIHLFYTFELRLLCVLTFSLLVLNTKAEDLKMLSLALFFFSLLVF